MEMIIVSFVIIILLIILFYIVLLGIKEGVLLNKILSISTLMIFAFWNPFLLKNLMQYSPEIFRHHILITFSIYIGTLLFYNILQSGKDTYHILGWNHKGKPQEIVEEALKDMSISYHTRENHTTIEDGGKIKYNKKDINFLHLHDSNIKNTIRKGIGEKLANKTKISSVINTLLSSALLIFFLLEAIRLF